MFDKYTVYSRAEIEAHDDQRTNAHVIVSIKTPGDEDAKILTNENTLGVLRLQFYDADKQCKEHGLFEENHAREILEFVHDNCTRRKTTPIEFIVHCDAGMSRSPAVAAAISKIYEGDDSMFFKRYHPNMRVHRMILDKFYSQEYGDQ